MRKEQRTKLAESIWRNEFGTVSIVLRVGKLYHESSKRPDGTEYKTLPLAKVKALRDAIKVQLRTQWEQERAATVTPINATTARPLGATLRDDAPVYLKARAALPTIADRTRQINHWVELFGDTVTRDLASFAIVTQRDAWVVAGKSASWINLRLRALSNLYNVLYNNTPNPVRTVDELDEPRPTPRAILAPVCAAIFRALPECVTKARLEVLAATGLEQSQLARISPDQWHLAEKYVDLPRRKKGRGVEAHRHELGDAGVAAVQHLHSYDDGTRPGGKRGYGFSTSSVYKTFRAACSRVQVAWNEAHADAPVDLSRLRPKDLRHTYGTAVYIVTNGNVQLTQRLLSQTTDAMALRYAAAAVDLLARQAADALGPLQGSLPSPQAAAYDGLDVPQTAAHGAAHWKAKQSKAARQAEGQRLRDQRAQKARKARRLALVVGTSKNARKTA